MGGDLVVVTVASPRSVDHPVVVVGGGRPVDLAVAPAFPSPSRSLPCPRRSQVGWGGTGATVVGLEDRGSGGPPGAGDGPTGRDW